MYRLIIPSITLLLAAPVVGQTDPEGERPRSWQVRLDRVNADPSDLTFVTMTPGWHITTGPAGILYDPANTASGQFTLESEMFLFPTNGRDREAFGIILGGRNLAGDNQSYIYFLIRNTGSYTVKRRAGADAPTIVPWTDSDVIVQQSGEDTAKNVLAVRASVETVDFMINGVTVASLPRSDLQVDGIFGIRVNHSINLHVSSLATTRGT